jgi:hypothetical protein
MAIIRRNWTRLRSALRLDFFSTIITNLGATPPPIPTPNPPLVEMNALLTAAQEAHNNVTDLEDRLKAARDTLNAALDALDDAITLQAATCEAATEGDPAALHAIGWEVIDTNPETIQPGKISELHVTAGDNDGEVDPNWHAERGTRSYEVQYNYTGLQGPWTNADPVTKSKTTLTGLNSGQRVYVRVRAIGSAGPAPWSDVISKMVP